jgi:hypothetical protein
LLSIQITGSKENPKEEVPEREKKAQMDDLSFSP